MSERGDQHQVIYPDHMFKHLSEATTDFRDESGQNIKYLVKERAERNVPSVVAVCVTSQMRLTVMRGGDVRTHLVHDKPREKSSKCVCFNARLKKNVIFITIQTFSLSASLRKVQCTLHTLNCTNTNVMSNHVCLSEPLHPAVHCGLHSI